MNTAVSKYSAAILGRFGIPEASEGWDTGYDAIVDAYTQNPGHEDAHLVSVGIYAVRRWLGVRRQTESLDHLGRECQGLLGVEMQDFENSLSEAESRVYNGGKATEREIDSFYSRIRREMR